eukprot:g3833.t1
MAGLQSQIAEMVTGMVRADLEAQEERVDSILKKLDNASEDDMEKLRQKRLARLKKAREDKLNCLKLGHGEYFEVFETEKFFEHCKQSPKVIVHFYRPETQHCLVYDKHLKVLAKKYIGVKFFKINAEKHQFICERLKIWCLPTLVLIKAGHTESSLIGFSELGNTPDFSQSTLETVLNNKGMIKYDGPEDKEEASANSHGPKKFNTKTNAIRVGGSSMAIREDEGDDIDWDN